MSTPLADISETPGQPAWAALNDPILERLVHYLQCLGCSDPVLIEQLAESCLDKARLRAAPGSEPELLRRSLEEAQRRFNQALATALKLTPGTDEKPLAAARAAFLLREEKLDANALFRDAQGSHRWCDELTDTLPNSTPQESPLDVPVKPLRFWLFKS